MGQDKALMEFAGKPLVQRVVEKLHHLCREVWILGDRPDLAAYAPCLPDIHPGCGPLGGLETALFHTHNDWSLILPVDVPLLPIAWIEAMTEQALRSTGVVAMAIEEGKEHPLCALYHRELLPFFQHAIAAGDYKVMRAVHNAVDQLAAKRGCKACDLLVLCSPDISSGQVQRLSPQQRDAQSLWFTNLNTPDDFAVAVAHVDALDEV